MAQVLPGFDADGFRDAIRTAMQMGAPADADRQPVFVLEVDPDLTDGFDDNGVPWDPQVKRLEPALTDVRVDCAVEYGELGQDTDRFGRSQPQDVTITLLDVDYAKVKGFRYVKLWPAGDTPVRYYYQGVAAQPTLDSVGVWSLKCTTEDAA